ncbi:hypothetical protein [Burkholderia sp. LMG 21824]|uniref:hypothetical protein n=1 Tax=Burkholderia sp. LMG 21824 TaxID=3158172 RepID=UPI003C2CD518
MAADRVQLARRFVVTDPFMSALTMTGTVLAAITAELHAAGTAAGSRRGLAVEKGALSERAAVSVLQTLGLTRAEAEDVANRPLPPGDFTVLKGN